MSRRRKPAAKKPLPPTTAQKAAQAFRAFVRENVRLMLLFIGGGLWLQVLVPWTTRAWDNVFFIVMGGVMLGLAAPWRLWHAV